VISRTAIRTALFLCAASTLCAEPLTMKQAEQLAEGASFDLRILRAEQNAAREVERTRFRDYFPQAGISYRQNRSIAQRNFDTGSYSVQLNVSQPVYDGGRTSLAHEIAGIDVRMARERYNSQKSAVRFSAREGYLRLQQSKASLELARENLKNAESMFERARIQLRQGEMSQIDFKDIESRLETHKLELKKRQDAHADSTYDFASLLRIDPGSIEVAGVDLFSLAPAPDPVSESELVSRALQKRPDLREARIELEKARREYLITEYYYLPTVALTGRYGKTGEKWPPTTAEWGVGVNVTFNLFGSTLQTDAQSNRTPTGASQGFSAGGNLDIYNNAAYDDAQIRNEIELGKAREKKEQLLRHIEETVRREKRSLERAREELDLLDRTLANKEQRFLVSNLRYRRGELSLDRLLEDELKLIEERYSLIEARVNYVLSCGKFELGLGLELDELSLFTLPEAGPDAHLRAWQSRFRAPSGDKRETL
jgi:outer membrane protein